MIGRIKSVRPLRAATAEDVRVKNGRQIQIGDAIDGFLFVRDEQGLDRFAHRSELQDGVELSNALVGLYVEFIPSVHPKGPRCQHVRLLHTLPASLDPVALNERPHAQSTPSSHER